jgi:site-specific recombinase XerD
VSLVLTGSMQGIKTVLWQFQGAAKRAGIPAGFRPHRLRHAFASAQLSHGVPITNVARWMGYKDIRETYNTYSHFMPEAEDRATAVLEAEYLKWITARIGCRDTLANPERVGGV